MRPIYLAFFLIFCFQPMVGTAQLGTFSPATQVENLRQMQQLYQNIVLANTWAKIDPAVCLVACEKDATVEDLKNNLQLTQDFPAHLSAQDSLFDDVLLAALRKFQARNGLEPDGIVGPQTLEALNTSPAQRLQQITINLQRWEANLFQPAERTVWVNLPDFTLHLLDSTGTAVWQTRVIIGQTNASFQTIPLESYMGYMVLNPIWTVPQSILRREIVPMLKNDPQYLNRHQMLVYRTEGNARTLVPGQELLSHPADVAAGKFWVVQQPGPSNSLGNIKFMFPNPHDIYLHDTPSRALFNHNVRTYSHGCVRVENPAQLGAFLLNPDWNAEPKVDARLRQKTLNNPVYLPQKVKVQLTYFTAWVDQTGKLQFRKDVYGLDKKVAVNYPKL